MKKIKLNFVLICCVVGLCIIVDACKKESTPKIPFQGPQNSSFETAELWNFTSNFSGPGNADGGSTSAIITGTTFLPSNGIKYASLTGFSKLYAGTATVFQDNVDISHSTTMSFDYTFTGTFGAGGTATAQILFTSNGTQTLWTKTIDNASILPAQKLKETITLPITTLAGRLTIITSANPGTGGSETKLTFGLDNITVK
jgi:hypothetical protein